MSSQSPKRRAYTPEEWAKRTTKAITSDVLTESGKLAPAQGKFRSGIQAAEDKKKTTTVTRQKVVGVLEEENGQVYLTQFKAQEENDSEPLDGNDPDSADDEKDGENEDLTDMDPVTAAKKSMDPDEGASWYCPILKADEEQRLVTGIVLQPETTDAQGDIYDEDVIKTAAHDYMRSYNSGNVVGYMHKDMNRSLDLVESWVAPVDMELEGKEIKKGTWMMTVYVADADAWDKVKKGQITGFSIGGVAKVQKL